MRVTSWIFDWLAGAPVHKYDRIDEFV